MTLQSKFKKLVRARMSKTGESYTASRLQILRSRYKDQLRAEGKNEDDIPAIVIAAVLGVAAGTVRIKIFEEESQAIFRTSNSVCCRLVPGHIITLKLKKRWMWHDREYLTGDLVDIDLNIPALGLTPLPLENCGEYQPDDNMDLPETEEQLSEKSASAPCEAYEFDKIAFDLENELCCDAAELVSINDTVGAEKMLKSVLQEDLRCLDAHALLGKIEFSRDLKKSSLHYQVGLEVAKLSFTPDFNGFLPRSYLYNRPFLRCLHGYGLCLWRMKDFEKAIEIFEWSLRLNPGDIKTRLILDDLKKELPWEGFKN